MKHRNRIFWRAIALCAAIFAFGFACPARLPYAPSAYAQETSGLLEIALSVNPEEMVAPGDVMLTFSIENISAFDAHNVYLSSADGLLSEPIGQIPAGEKQTFNRQHSVSRAELDEGFISYIISHDDPADSEIKINYSLRAQLHRIEARPQVEFTRQLSSAYVSAGNTVTLTYRVRNVDNVALNSIRVSDTLGDFIGRVEQLGVGETRTLISRVTITEASVSSASLSYCVDTLGDAIITQQLSDLPISLAQAKIDAQLSAGYAAFAGNTADVLLTLTNSGNVGYRDICITDDIYGGVIADNLRLESGAPTLEISATYPLRSEEGFRWRITGVSEAGDQIDFLTNTVALESLSDETQPELRIWVQAVTPLIDRAGNVRMRVSIENSSKADTYDVSLNEPALGEIYKFAVLPAESTTNREFLIYVNDSMDYCFTAGYVDSEGWLHEAQSNIASVQIHPNGVLPEGAKRSFIEFTGNSIKIGGSSLFAVLLISGSVVLVILIIILLVATRRARFEKKLRMAAEKQRRRAGARPAAKQVRPAPKPKKEKDKTAQERS